VYVLELQIVTTLQKLINNIYFVLVIRIILQSKRDTMTQEKKRNNRRRQQADNLLSASTEMGHVPPQAVDVEAAVLGAMMVNPDSVDAAIEILNEKCFYDLKHRSIFEAMLELYSERSPIDMLTVIDRLKQKGNLAVVGGPAMLAGLTTTVGTGATVEYYVRILQQKAIQPNLIEAAYGILKDAFNETVTVDELIHNSSESVFSAISGNEKNPYQHVGEVVNRSMDRIQFVQSTTGITGVHSGFTELDKYTMGWQKGNLIILGARPSVGKTAFALNLARNAAVEFGHGVAIFSLEMTDVELTDRLIASESGISADKLKGKVKMVPEEWVVLEQSLKKLVKAPLYIDQTPGITLTDFVAKARRLVREKGVEIIFVDYLQLMHSGKPQAGGFSKVQEVTEISNTLKTTAKDLGIPIVALAQLNRNLMARAGSNGKPVLSDLKDSGSIEQDADMVIFIHRPGMLGMSEDLSEAEIIIAKNRSGQVGSIPMRYNGDLVRFEDAKPLFYESKINDGMQYGKQPKSGNKAYDPYSEPIPPPYNPFDHSNDFLQNDFSL
jgi:replicative DNA helicase